MYLPAYHNERMWWWWLQRGFKEIGEYQEDPNLNPGRLKFIYPMVLRQGDREFLWDFSDFVSFTQPELRMPRFKIQLLKESIVARPIAQVCAKPEYEDHRKTLRLIPKRHDVDVIGMFRATEYEERLEWLEKVRSLNVNSRLALWDSPNRPKVPEHLSDVEKLNYFDHVDATYHAKIGLALPGIGFHEGSTWSFRHSELLGVGTMVIMPETKLIYPGDTKGCWVHTTSDKVKDVIKYYLKNDKEREEIARNGLAYYEKYIRPDSMARYIIEHL